MLKDLGKAREGKAMYSPQGAFCQAREATDTRKAWELQSKWAAEPWLWGPGASFQWGPSLSLGPKKWEKFDQVGQERVSRGGEV